MECFLYLRSEKPEDLVQCGCNFLHLMQQISIDDCVIQGEDINNNELCHQLLETILDFEGYNSQWPVRLSVEPD